jgi:hypothetical protein
MGQMGHMGQMGNGNNEQTQTTSKPAMTVVVPNTTAAPKNLLTVIATKAPTSAPPQDTVKSAAEGVALGTLALAVTFAMAL